MGRGRPACNWLSLQEAELLVLPGENAHGGAHILVPEMAHAEKQGAEKLMVCALLHGPLTPSLVPSR